MTDNSDNIAASIAAHADKIMRAAGSQLGYYETRSKAAILAAVMSCYEEAYRAGADFAMQEIRGNKR